MNQLRDYRAGAMRVRPLRWRAVVVAHFVTPIVVYGMEQGGMLVTPVGHALTERGAWRKAERYIASNNLPRPPFVLSESP